MCLKADLVGSLCYICCCCSGRVVVSGQLPPSHGRGCHSPQILSHAAANQADDQWDQPATWPVRGWPMGKHLPCSGWRLPISALHTATPTPVRSGDWPQSGDWGRSHGHRHTYSKTRVLKYTALNDIKPTHTSTQNGHTTLT